MAASSKRKELFRNSTIKDKLNFFQLLFDSQTLTADLALVFLKIIHEDLNNHQKPDRTVFRRYAGLVASLRYHLPEMYKQVIDEWETHQGTNPSE